MSPGSSEEKIRDLYAEVSDAVEDGLVTDAASRNALYKIHVSLGKIVNSLDELQQPLQNRQASRGASVSLDKPTMDEKTLVEGDRIEEEDDDSHSGTVILKQEDNSLPDELLDEDTKMEE